MLQFQEQYQEQCRKLRFKIKKTPSQIGTIWHKVQLDRKLDMVKIKKYLEGIKPIQYSMKSVTLPIIKDGEMDTRQFILDNYKIASGGRYICQTCGLMVAQQVEGSYPPNVLLLEHLDSIHDHRPLDYMMPNETSEFCTCTCTMVAMQRFGCQCGGMFYERITKYMRVRQEGLTYFFSCKHCDLIYTGFQSQKFQVFRDLKDHLRIHGVAIMGKFVEQLAFEDVFEFHPGLGHEPSSYGCNRCSSGWTVRDEKQLEQLKPAMIQHSKKEHDIAVTT